MTGSTKKDNKATASRRLITSQDVRQADRIIDGFKRMRAKCESSSRASRSPSPARNASVDPLDFKRDLLVQIESSLLPQLRQHIITLNELLKPADFLHEPTRKLK
ncbi:hypothetical protein PSTG_02511 [Puccinia striiformis f. sp. tritici PST-78]|uniref:Uncharacterized protein n=1 Tax=Puccinia striiformis f. sp. tritici PST-78 TaxID=1165861 RepID=A0A0L0VYT0_9BASI|nr:hypothetical protein PSTG_02511 [Puccinia striiformis f. sp. tritici PST-78]